MRTILNQIQKGIQWSNGYWPCRGLEILHMQKSQVHARLTTLGLLRILSAFETELPPVVILRGNVVMMRAGVKIMRDAH